MTRLCVPVPSGRSAPGPTIGHSFAAETIFPQMYRAHPALLRDTTLCDCPGFYDNRGIAYEAIAAIFTQYAIRSLCTARRLRGFFVVVEYHAIFVGRSDGIRSIIYILQRVCVRPDHLNVALIFTKVPRGVTKADITTLLKAIAATCGESMRAYVLHLAGAPLATVHGDGALDASDLRTAVSRWIPQDGACLNPIAPDAVAAHLNTLAVRYSSSSPHVRLLDAWRTSCSPAPGPPASTW